MKPSAWRALLFRFSALFALVGLAGCATLSPQRSVNVAVVDVQAAQATLFETTAVVTLRLTNETPAPLSLKGSTSKLSLNGSSVGTGVSNEALTLPPLGSVTQSVTLHLENLTLLRKAHEFSQAPDTLDYRLETQWFSTDGGGTRDLRTTATGQLDVRSLLGVAGALAR
jgi:LEA14-like dessication related protein